MKRRDFIAKFTGFPPYDWQAGVSDALTPVGAKVCLRAANESGKTSTAVAPNICYDLLAFPQATVVVTSSSWTQVIQQVLPSVKRFGRQFQWKINKDYIETPTGGRVVAISTDDPGKFEGFHAGKDLLKEPLSIYMDEAKSIPEEIFEAASRCNPTRLYVGSSPGVPAGGFYRIANSESYKQFIVTAFDCPHLGPDHIEKVAKEHGISSLIYKSMIEAEWMADPNELYVISRLAIDRCLRTPPEWMKARVIAAIDVARSESGDENVLALRNGNRLSIDTCFVGSGDSMRVVDRLIGRLDALKINPNDVWIDYDGMGGQYHDIFARKGWHLSKFRGGSKAMDEKRYANRIAESWMKLAVAIEDQRVILPQDETFVKQMSSRRYRIQETTQKIILESKENLKHSPDRADALAMVWHISAMTGYQAFNSMEEKDSGRMIKPTLKERFLMEREPEYEAIAPGFNVGI